MEVNKPLWLLVLCLLFFITIGIGVFLAFFMKEEDKQIEGLIPYQIFKIDDDKCMCLYLFDQWGEDNLLVYKDNEQSFSTRIFADPCIPIISKIIPDTVFLEYYASRRAGETKNIFQCKDTIGPYKIMESKYYYLESTGLIGPSDFITGRSGWNIDSINIIENHTVQCFYKKELVTTIPLHRFFYIKKLDEQEFSTFKLDTLGKNSQSWFFYFPTESAIQQYRKYTNNNVSNTSRK
jgi:hypothetical protein